MRKTLLAACLLSTFAATAGAQSSEGGYLPKGLRPFIGVGFTSGGDTILPVTVTVQNSSTRYHEDISAGGGLDLRIGLSQRLGDLPWTLQVAAAYHNDQSNGVEGSKYRFRRMPIEATLLWHATDRARIGFGVRKATNATFKIDNGTLTDSAGNVYSNVYEKYALKASTGFIVEGEYAVTPGWSLKGRFVFESFRYRDYPQAEKVDAEHFGVQSVWYLP